MAIRLHRVNTIACFDTSASIQCELIVSLRVSIMRSNLGTEIFLAKAEDERLYLL